jgi:propanol-preferring alcohol dehydrogenase
MKAQVLNRITDLSKDEAPLELVEMPVPEPGDGEVLLRVSACGVCHTELDEIEGRTPPLFFPMMLGHEVVGRVEKLGRDAVAVGWMERSAIHRLGNRAPTAIDAQ